MATHRLPLTGSYEDLFYKAITFCSAKDCTTICRRNQNTRSFKDFLEKLTDDFFTAKKISIKIAMTTKRNVIACIGMVCQYLPVRLVETLSTVRAIPGRVHAG